MHVEAITADAIRAGQDHRDHAGDVVCRVEAVGAEILDQPHVESNDAAIVVDGGSCLHGLLAGMDRSEQVLAPLLPPPDGAAQMTRERGDDQLLSAQRNLLAEGAADVRADHRHLRLFQPEPGRERRAQRVRRLVAEVHRQVLAALVPIRAAAPGFERHMGLPVLDEAGLDDPACARESGCRVAMGECLVGDEVGADCLVHEGRMGRQSGLRRGQGGERFIVDAHHLRRIQRRLPAAGHDAGDEVAIEPDLGHRHGFHGGRQQTLDRRGHVQRRGPPGEVVTVDDRLDPWCRPGGRSVDAEQAGMRVGGAYEDRVERAGKNDVVKVAGLPGQETGVLAAAQTLADGAFWRRHGRSERPVAASNTCSRAGLRPRRDVSPSAVRASASAGCCAMRAGSP